ncbi:protein of unknown function [Clostridium beijerinckii]|nr:protein of unknown function [Clostridium beijerinckii]
MLLIDFLKRIRIIIDIMSYIMYLYYYLISKILGGCYVADNTLIEEIAKRLNFLVKLYLIITEVYMLLKRTTSYILNYNRLK